MKKLFSIILCLFLVSSAYAGRLVVISPFISSSVVETCDAGSPTLLFWWNFTDTDVSDNQCVASGGDSSAALSGEASVTGGTLTLIDTSNNGNDYYYFQNTSATVPQADFTIEMKINLPVISNNSRLFIMYDDAVDDYHLIRFNTASGNDIYFYRVVNSVNNVTVTFDCNLSTSTDYWLVFRSSTTDGPDMWVGTSGWPDVDSGSGSNGTWIAGNDTLTAFDSTADNFIIGSNYPGNLEGTFTEFFKIYNGWKTYP